MKKNKFSLRKKVISMLGGVVKNTMSLPQQFLRYGSRGEVMLPNWSDVQMNDEDHYKGYGFGAIYRRAVMVQSIAKEYVKTESDQKDFTHPYLDVLKKSPTFTDFQFWTTVSTFLDLEGWFPLLAVRNFDANRKGHIKEFKLLNPYHVRRVVRYTEKGMEIGGYIETRGGFVREIPKEMIIDIRNLNPFADNVPFGITDAAKDSQFTMKTSGDYTRSAVRNNINAPGIISTDVQLEEKDFKNFMKRVSSHTKGEPLFGNGTGAIKWESMQIELAKAALKDVNEINRDELFSTLITSKTIMGIEQSGTTRETAKVQKDLMIELGVLPQIQIIIDALNQDYRNNDPDSKTKKAEIFVDNPLGVDHDAKLKDAEVKKEQFELYKSLVDRGVDNKTAAAFVNGEIGLDALKIEKVEAPTQDPDDEPDDGDNDVDNSITVKNQAESQGLIQQQEGSLKNAIVRVEQQLLHNALNRLPKKIKNDVDLREKDVITQQEKNEAERDLELILLGFYGIVVNLQGQNIMRKRQGEFGLGGQFNFTKQIEYQIKLLSGKASASHIQTVVNEIYKTAADAAREGKSVIEIQGILKEKFTKDITETRAKSIARTETNRAFTTAQYEADRQFVEQNDLETRAYKKWVTRSGSPCPICEQLASEPPILLKKNFRDLGDSVNFKDGSFTIDYVALEAGNAHPNCSCSYELIIEKE